MPLKPDPGSFRDPANRVYDFTSTDTNDIDPAPIYRGVRESALEDFRRLQGLDFFQSLLADRSVVKTDECTDGPAFDAITGEGWDGVLQHQRIPFISYPYEWTFSMLKDAALLHLDIVEASLENGWTLKDATPYNIQWACARPVFIDIPSFEPRAEGAPWNGYRQFCAMFLVPLMLRAHLGIDYLPLLRSCLDGIPSPEAIKYFGGLKRFKKGVLPHIYLPARVEGTIARNERDGVEARHRAAPKHSDAMVIGLVQSLKRLVTRLTTDITHTDWSHYDKTHSYQDTELEAKKAFVEDKAKLRHHDLIWDIGCNTGTFSKLVAPHANFVLSLDGDHDAVEQLYLKERDNGSSTLLPMVMNLANVSPDQGWGGQERRALDHRRKPGLVLCLALIHHTRISANIPNIYFLRWLRSLDASVVVEFVNRHDEMVIKLLKNKKEQYADYNADQFQAECETLFDIADRLELKGGKREIFYLTPKPA